MDPKSYLKQALDLANQAAAIDEVPVGAVVVYQDQVISKGMNTRETEQNPLGHAELNAIADAAEALGSWRLIDCDLYVTLEPCPMCLAACQQARVRRVVYGAKDEKGGAICLGYHIHEDPKVNHRFEVIYEPYPECSQVLSDFFAAKRKSKS